MPIVTTLQALDISDVKNIVVTEAVQDTDTGEYVREIRIFQAREGTAEESEAMSSVLTVRLRSAVKKQIKIAVPELEF